METLVGFGVGFLVGTKEGKEGLAKIRESLAAIRSSAEVQRLVGEALAVLVPIMKEVARASGGRA
ncbi:MAG: hypothetical protein ACT4P1_09945 [Sporichthyaceae bacterium]